uniref:CCHC-type domain-containing protein n=1 Tax=Ciona savignyi TaxID=51511 RepID=H2Z4X4_CIOSA
MPRLHEHTQSMHTGRIMSVLLDIDQRYEMFWTNKEFCRFNMFNRFFFNNESKSSFELFLKLSKKFENIAIVVDPPFGGLVDCVCETLKWISNEASRLFNITPHEHQLLTTIWLFPYFMENRITNQLPLSMLDYQVAYDNHKRYKDSHQARYQSPVRLFTNIPNPCVELPAPNYRCCAVCERYVMKANKHCKICKTCPSKDGRTYKHCSICQVCVKPGRKHCVACSSCQPPGHTCRTKWCDGCHICGKTTHRRKDCPQSVEQADALAKMEINVTTIEAHTSSTCDLVFKPRKRSFRNLPSHRKK